MNYKKATGDHASGSQCWGRLKGQQGTPMCLYFWWQYWSRTARLHFRTDSTVGWFYITNHQHFGGTCLATLATFKTWAKLVLKALPPSVFFWGMGFFLLILPSPLATLPVFTSGLISPEAWTALFASSLTSGFSNTNIHPRDRLCGGDVWWIHVYNHFEVLLQSYNRKLLVLIAAVSPIGQFLGSDQHDALPKALMPFVQGHDSSWAEPPSHRLFL